MIPSNVSSASLQGLLAPVPFVLQAAHYFFNKGVSLFGK